MSRAEIAAVPSACAPTGEGQRSCSPRKSSMQWADKFVEDKLRSNAVTLFVKAGCPYCQNAQELLQRYTSSFRTPDVIKIDGKEEVQACLQRRTGQRTVPYVFFGKDYIGGSSELQDICSKLPRSGGRSVP